MIMIRLTPPAVLAKAIRRPSGDHVGWRSEAGSLVNRRASAPSKSIT